MANFDNHPGAIDIHIKDSGTLAAGATKTLKYSDDLKTVLWDTAAGSIVTLPAATGSQVTFRLLVSVLATSNSHVVQVANATDVMTGMCFGSRVDSGSAVLGFAAQSTSDTITLNRTTTGSVSLGEWVEVKDIASGIWHTRGFLSATGAAFATPYSAAVS